MPDTRELLDHRDDAELADLSRRTNGDVAKAALAVLGRRGASEAPRLARELLTGHPDDRVRALSAVILGREPDPDNRAALQAALNDAQPRVVRRVAQSLGRIGDAESLAALSRHPVPSDPAAARDVLAARTLLSYRLGIPAALVVAPATTRYVSRRPTELPFGGRMRVPRTAILAAAIRELPGLSLTAASLHPFTCAGLESSLVVDNSIGERSLDSPRLLGALLRERPCSDNRYSLDAYLLSDDRNGTRGTRPRLWLMRPSGRVVHAGHAEVGDGQADFVVSESVAPYGNPIRITGTYDLAKGRLTIAEAWVGKPSSTARKAAGPPLRAGLMRFS